MTTSYLGLTQPLLLPMVVLALLLLLVVVVMAVGMGRRQRRVPDEAVVLRRHPVSGQDRAVHALACGTVLQDGTGG